MRRSRTTLYMANIGLVCSNMEQIITVIGNVMDEMRALCQQYSKDTVGPSLKAGFTQWDRDERTKRNPQLEQTGSCL